MPTPLSKLVTRDHFGSWLNENEVTGTGVEVGTYFGAYAKVLANQWQGTLHTVDPYNWQAHPEYVDGCRVDWASADQSELDPEMVMQTAALTLSGTRCKMVRKESVEAAKDFEDDSLSFVYLDGDHSYLSVTADIIAWFPKVRKGGIFCGHDFYNRDDELMKGGVFDALWERFLRWNKKPHVTQCTSWWFIK